LNYYVYYKVPPDRLAEITAVVELLFQTVQQNFGVRGRWMRRRDDPTTYMEVYEGVREDAEALARFEDFLEREGAQLGLARKVERFISAERPV
jgi:uncharacterized protein DUF4936